jgi:adenosine deaminase
VRVAHGIRAAEDPALTRILARLGVVLDVCPTSNVATGALPSTAEVAVRIRTLLAAGVPVSISTDDPGLFGTTLYREFRGLAAEGFSAGQLNALVRGAELGALSR